MIFFKKQRGGSVDDVVRFCPRKTLVSRSASMQKRVSESTEYLLAVVERLQLLFKYSVQSRPEHNRRASCCIINCVPKRLENY